MHGLALAILIYLACGAIWDTLDPRAVRVTFGNPLRGLMAAAAQVALIVLCILALSVSAATGIAIGVAVLALALASAVAER